jgi:hypothetical protein
MGLGLQLPNFHNQKAEHLVVFFTVIGLWFTPGNCKAPKTFVINKLNQSLEPTIMETKNRKSFLF